MSRIPLKLTDDTDPESLCCPWCHGEYTHQGKVEVFSRKEDESRGAHAVVLGERTEVDSDAATGNPSARRDGIRITFECENCKDHPFTLCIAQHKGNTHIYLAP